MKNLYLFFQNTLENTTYKLAVRKIHLIFFCLFFKSHKCHSIIDLKLDFDSGCNLFNWGCRRGWDRLSTSKIFIVPTVKAPHEVHKTYKQNLFTMLSSWDTAFCFHFGGNSKWPPEPKRVTSQVFWCFLLPKFL